MSGHDARAPQCTLGRGRGRVRVRARVKVKVRHRHRVRVRVRVRVRGRVAGVYDQGCRLAQLGLQACVSRVASLHEQGCRLRAAASHLGPRSAGISPSPMARQ